MKSNSDIGENTAVVVTIGLALGFTGWLVKQMFSLATVPHVRVPRPSALRVTELKEITESEVLFDPSAHV